MIESLSVTELAYYCASLINFIFAITISLKYKKLNTGITFCIAAFINGLWLLSIAFFNPIDFTDANINVAATNIQLSNLEWLLITEMLHYCAWLIAFTKAAQRYCPNCIPTRLRYILYISGLLLPLAAVFGAHTEYGSEHGLKILAWSGILLSVLCLLTLEQLYRNMGQERLMRLIWIALSFNFLFDAFLFSQNLVVLSLSSKLWQVRASISLVTFTFMTISVLTMQSGSSSRANLAFSQPAIFYTTSLSVAGFILILLSVGGYYVRLHDTSWAAIFYSTVSTIGIVSIAVLFSSDRVRRRLNVFLNKHLFNYKYDYRSEWLKLIRLLSQTSEHEGYSMRALSASADLFRCDNGVLWQKRGDIFTPTATLSSSNTADVEDEPLDSEFARILKSGWIFSPNSVDAEMSRNNDSLPSWLAQMSDSWLIFPLLIEEDISGFIVLSQPRDTEMPNWEDLDLAKTVGRQIANHISRHEQSELLAQARQFETFNKLSAFVMHDLKNLIAQQSLVVKNAEKHKDNPAFVDDAINTIKNSVDRMNNLLRKLRQNEPEETKVLQVKELLIEAVRRCQKTLPAPTLLKIDDNVHVKADFDSLVMVFTHIIHNAQDATPAGGFIDIYLESSPNKTLICIEDNGEGMTEEFIRTKLFQPFESTKSGKGMGVGVYQAREYVENLGGEVSVESTPNEGTKFTLSIPIAQA